MRKSKKFEKSILIEDEVDNFDIDGVIETAQFTEDPDCDEYFGKLNNNSTIDDLKTSDESYKTKRTKKVSKTESKKTKKQSQADIDEDEDIKCFTGKNQSSGLPENSFFYTSDKFFLTFEDNDMMKYIQERYPHFDINESNDTLMRKTIIDMLNDTKFMTTFLDHFSINVYDFFKYLFRVIPNIFKGLFLKRIRKALKYKKYAVAMKKLSYSEKKKTRKRMSSKNAK